MGLLQNGFRDSVGGGMRFFGAGVSNGAYPYALVANRARTAAKRNLTAGQGITDETVGIPYGYRAPGAWMLPQKAGALSSRNAAVLTLASAGLAVGGITTTGAASLVLDFAPAAGSLITSADGTADLTIGATAELLGILTGGGVAAFALMSTSSALLGAEASMAGAGAFRFSGAMLPYAVGNMEGSTITDDVLTADQIAAATVAALQATTIPVDVQQVRGQEIEGVGSEADPWGPA